MAQSLMNSQDETAAPFKNCERSENCSATSLVNGDAGTPWRGAAGVRGRPGPGGVGVSRMGVVVVVYLCLWQVGSVLSCGNNPLRRFRPLSRMLGKDISTLLEVLRSSNPTLYTQIEDEWRTYADCVRQVDTGYFKRSGSPLQGPFSGEKEDRVKDEGEEALGGWDAPLLLQQRRRQGEVEERRGRGTLLIGLLVPALDA
ncbi:hypothetical protein ACOMHN_045851 [Nucella lapillus]